MSVMLHHSHKWFTAGPPRFVNNFFEPQHDSVNFVSCDLNAPWHQLSHTRKWLGTDCACVRACVHVCVHAGVTEREQPPSCLVRKAVLPPSVLPPSVPSSLFTRSQFMSAAACGRPSALSPLLVHQDERFLLSALYQIQVGRVWTHKHTHTHAHTHTTEMRWVLSNCCCHWKL